jgi:hypothetical protein
MYDQAAYRRMTGREEKKEEPRASHYNYQAVPVTVIPRDPLVKPPLTRGQVSQQIANLNSILQKETFSQKWFKCCFETRESVKLKKRELKEDCSICTCEAEDGETWSETSCKHFFHTECLKDWINTFDARDNGCPLCRASIVGAIKESFMVN